VAGEAEDQQAWFVEGASLVVHGGVALTEAGTGAELVFASEGRAAW
jgi:hypothetical protein